MARVPCFLVASICAVLPLACGGSETGGGPANRYAHDAGAAGALPAPTGPGDASDTSDAPPGSDASAPPACPLAAHTPSDWRLAAAGTQLRDALGRKVFLRGVNAGGRSKFAPYVPFDYGTGQYASALGAYMDRAASWGIDVIRVPFTWAALEPTQGHDDSDWLSRYDQLLAAAWARGIYTIVDFHQDVYSEAFCGDGFPPWTLSDPPASHHDCPNWSAEYFVDSAVAAAFDAFWGAGSSVQTSYLSAWDVMVARYKDTPGVLGFEPINEPGWGTANEQTFAATTLTAFFSAMVARMQAAAPSSLVFVEPPGPDGGFLSTALGRPTGGGVVFAPHFYPLSSDPTMVQSELMKWVDVSTTWNAPLFIGEFGVPRDNTGALDFVTAHFAGFDALGLSGSEWEYSVSADSWNSETYGLVAADGGEYPIAQAVMRPFARAVDGDEIVQSFDPPTQTFSLTYTPGHGVTEVSLPARIYASGYSMTLAGACADATSSPGRLLLQPEAGAPQVSLRIVPK